MIDPLERIRGLDFSAVPEVAPHAAPAVERVLAGTPAERALDQLLRQHRDWGAAHRLAAAELVFGIGLWRRRLAREPERNSGPELIALFLRDLAGFGAEEAARAAGIAAVPEPFVPATLAERYSVPDWIAAIFEREVGAELESLLSTLNVPGPIVLRANLLAGSREELLERLRTEGVEVAPARYAPTALVAAKRFNVYGSAAYREGRFEMQDEGSQLLGHLVGARPAETVLDFCAGAGGKSLLLAAALENRGALYVHDADPERLDRLVTRAERARARVRVLRAVPAELAADAVLVDAPCSELGALRRGTDLRFRIDRDEVAKLPEQQEAILRRASRHVRPGGRLVYATCTWNRAENEAVVEAFLSAHPDFSLAPLPAWAAPFAAGAYFKSFPHRQGTDGFFAAVMTRGT